MLFSPPATLGSLLLLSAQALAAATPAQSSLKWADCPAGSGYTGPGVQCSNLTVPIDGAQPSLGTIQIGILRVKSNATNCKGSVWLNPGGPGGAAAPLAYGWGTTPGTPGYQLLSEYDLIGVDPRGIGLSSPLKCDPSLWNIRVKTMVQNAAEYQTLVNHWKAVGQSCKDKTGPLFDYLDTVHVVQDFDLVRQALGDAKLNFLGLSYGTQLAYTYAEQFPESTGRMVLDGVVDHSQMPPSTVQSESSTYELTLQKFFTWCKQNTTCALHGQDPQAVFEGIAAQALATPIPAPGCVQTGPNACQPNVMYEDFLYNAQGFLIVENGQFPGSWAGFSYFLEQAAKGNATAFSMPYYTTEVNPSSYNMWVSQGTGCQDWLHPAKSYLDILAVERMTNALSPVTRGFSQGFGYVSQCVGWPAPVTNGQRPILSSIDKAPQLLLVQSFYDPECSVQWAVGVREQIPNSNLIFRNGSGHTSVPLEGATSHAALNFLLNGVIPADGTVYQS